MPPTLPLPLIPNRQTSKKHVYSYFKIQRAHSNLIRQKDKVADIGSPNDASLFCTGNDELDAKTGPLFDVSNNEAKN